MSAGHGTSVDAWAAAPYPGERPAHGFVQDDRRVVELRRGPDGLWHLVPSGLELGRWLAGGDHVPLASRVPLLCYGSNACPSKLHDLRGSRGLTGPVVMTPCSVSGLAAAWCAGERTADRAVPATLVAAGGVEEHFLWWVGPEQWSALDRCEGRGERYDLVRLPAGRVRDDQGRPVPDVHAYVGVAPARQPMRDPVGRPLLVRELDQRAARRALLAAGRR
jgi:hypothetical protein